MEIRINKEIREYNESIFFGLTLRQCLCVILAMFVAVVVYFVLRDYLSLEPLSWLCMISALPFALVGFVKYHNMYFEDFARCFVRSFILSRKPLVYKSENMYEAFINQKKLEEKKGVRRREFENIKKKYLIKPKKKENTQECSTEYTDRYDL